MLLLLYRDPDTCEECGHWHADLQEPGKVVGCMQPIAC